jgi:hypothetical protein
MIMILTIIGGIGYILLACAKPVAVRYLGCFFAASGIFPAIANILPWVLSKFRLAQTSPYSHGVY